MKKTQKTAQDVVLNEDLDQINDDLQSQIDNDIKSDEDKKPEKDDYQVVDDIKNIDPEMILETINNLSKELETSQKETVQAKETAQRANADYQNLVRRSREEKTRFAKMANHDLIEALLQPVEHLSMAASQIEDPGLDMVVGQFKQVLADFDLKEIEVMDKEFDIDTMEVVEKNGKEEKVIKVIQKGYQLNGVVIQHAKVALG